MLSILYGMCIMFLHQINKSWVRPRQEMNTIQFSQGLLAYFFIISNLGRVQFLSITEKQSFFNHLLVKDQQSVVSIYGPLGYGPSTLPLRHSAFYKRLVYSIEGILPPQFLPPSQSGLQETKQSIISDRSFHSTCIQTDCCLLAFVLRL